MITFLEEPWVTRRRRRKVKNKYLPEKVFVFYFHSSGYSATAQGRKLVHENNAYLKNLALENIFKWCPTFFDIKCKFSWKVCSYKYDYPFRKKLKPLMSRPLFNYFHLYYRFFTVQTKVKVPIKMNFLFTGVWLWLVCKFIRLTGHLLWRVSKFYSKNPRPWCKLSINIGG